jgi:hypothetical protein
MLSRRQLMSGLVSFAALSGRTGRASAAPSPRKPQPVTLRDPLNKAVFLALLHEVFTISTDRGRVGIQLIEVDDGPPSTVTEQFTVVFRGPRHWPLAEGTYPVSHHSAGSTLLLLQPIGYDHGHLYYGAVFNLLL